VLVGNPRAPSARGSQAGVSISLALVTPRIQRVTVLKDLLSRPVLTFGERVERRRSCAAKVFGLPEPAGSTQSHTYALYNATVRVTTPPVERYACQVGSARQVTRAQDSLVRMGFDAAECSGQVTLTRRAAPRARVVCGVPLRTFIMASQPGNRATACRPSSGSCASGPPVCPAQETICFEDLDAFPVRDPFSLEGAYRQPVSRLALLFQRRGGPNPGSAHLVQR
jgi:hypothetical protein